MRKCVEIYTRKTDKEEQGLERRFRIFKLNYIILRGITYEK